MNERAGLVVANFNCHSGIDGWGRQYDLVEACRGIDADVLVLPELFVPDEISEAPWLDLTPLQGYELHWTELARARILRPEDGRAQSDRWGPLPVRKPRAIRLDGPASSRRRLLRPEERREPTIRGSFGLAVLARVPVKEWQEIELPELRRDPAKRRAIVATVILDGVATAITGVHLGHLSHGSMRQIAALRRALRELDGPGALLGDMNCWGPPLVAMLPGWRRAVLGRTYPAERPLAQIDHLLVNREMTASEATVLPSAGSDHRPIRARLQPAGATGWRSSASAN